MDIHMSINAAKSAVFGATVTNRIGVRNITRVIPITSSEWSVRGTPIPCIQPDNSSRYLEKKFGVLGKTKYDLVPKLDQWFNAIKKSLLKPFQKMIMLKTYVLPRLNNHFSMNSYQLGALNWIQLVLIRLPERSCIFQLHLIRCF